MSATIYRTKNYLYLPDTIFFVSRGNMSKYRVDD